MSALENPPLRCRPVEIEDLICSSDPLGFFFFFLTRGNFSNRSTYYNTFRKHCKQARSLHYIPPSRRLPRLSLFCSIFRGKKCSFLPLSSSPQQRPPDGEPETLQNLSQPSMFCFFEVLFALTAPLRPASHLRGITAPTATVHTSKKEKTKKNPQ